MLDWDKTKSFAKNYQKYDKKYSLRKYLKLCWQTDVLYLYPIYFLTQNSNLREDL